MGGEAGTWLHRRTREPLAHHPDPRCLRGAVERRLDRGLVTVFEGQRQVAGDLVVQERGPGAARRLDRRDGRQILVVDADLFGGVLGQCSRFGDHHRDRLADVADAVASEDRHRGDLLRCIVHALQRGAVRQRSEPGAIGVGDRQHAQDTRQRQRVGGVDGGDPRVGAIGPDHERVDHVGRVPVGAEGAGAGHQSRIFLAQHAGVAGGTIGLEGHRSMSSSPRPGPRLRC